MAEREVEAKRVGGVDPPEGIRDLPRRGPPRRPAPRQAQVPADAEDVRVQRDDERRRRHAGPEAQVDPVVRADDPAQEQEKALERASVSPVRNEMLKTVRQPGLSAYGRRIGSQERREPGEGRTKVRSLAVEPVEEHVLERPVQPERLADREEKKNDVLAPAEAISDPLEPIVDLRRLGGSDRSRRTRTQAGEDFSNRPGSDIRPAVGERGRDKGRDFPVGPGLIPAGESDGIEFDPCPPVPAGKGREALLEEKPVNGQETL